MTNQPPPGFEPPPQNTPPAGQFPPGYQPQFPPGYVPYGAEVPPGAMPPPVPLTAYVANPAMPQPAPAASGSVSQAWLSIATRPARERIASWAQAADASWVKTSLIASAVIAAVAGLINAGILFAVRAQIPNQTFGASQLSFHKIGVGYVIAQIIEGPIQQVGGLLAVSLGLALFMPQTYGPLKERFLRVLKPIALAAIGVQIVAFLYGLINSIVVAAFAPALQHLADLSQQAKTNPDPALSQQIASSAGPVAAYGCITALVGLAFAAYAITVWVQSGAVGSNMNRWAVFGIGLLSAIVFGIVMAIVFLPLNLLASF